jgi:hypothetical protein
VSIASPRISTRRLAYRTGFAPEAISRTRQPDLAMIVPRGHLPPQRVASRGLGCYWFITLRRSEQAGRQP